MPGDMNDKTVFDVIVLHKTCIDSQTYNLFSGFQATIKNLSFFK